MLEITYGICAGKDAPYLTVTLDSILNQYHDNPNQPYEILLATDNVGPWLPQKKNWIAQNAKFDTLVLLHDYYFLDMEWLFGMEIFSENLPEWKVCTNKILTKEGTRHTDWMINPRAMQKAIKQRPELVPILMAANPHENGPQFINALPYDCFDFLPQQYISGGYIICKRDVLLDNPLDETMQPGQPEDLEWSERVFSKPENWPYFNRFSQAHVLKPRKWVVTQIPDEALKIMREVDFDVS